jgi:hypothetical protein
LTIRDRVNDRVVYQGTGEDLPKANLPADVAKKAHDLILQNDEARLEIGSVMGIAQAFTLTHADKDHEITVKGDASGRHLAVKDLQSGKTLYDGPAAPEQWKDLPADVQKKIKDTLAAIH